MHRRATTALPFALAPMRIQVLGAAAGGGFPQWNCNCRLCDGVRRGSVQARARTQSSIALQGAPDGGWLLVNASPDLLLQLRQAPQLQPARALRDTALAGVLLTDAQVDHTTGLYMLREWRQPLPLWCTDAVHEDLTQGNPVLRVLQHFCGVDHHRLPLDDKAVTIPGMPGVRLTALALHSKAPPYSPHREATVPGDNIGLIVDDERSGARLFYAPGLGEHDARVDAAMRSADCVLVDGTFWTDDEMIALGLSHKTGRSIGHLPQHGPGGMIEWLDTLPRATRRILIHINNTNPILDEASPERAVLQRHGIEVAHDGLQIEL